LYLNHKFDEWYLFNIADDYHELHDKKEAEPARYQQMLTQANAFLASIQNSQVNETKCKASKPPKPTPAPPTPPTPAPAPSSACNFTEYAGLHNADASTIKGVTTKEACCGACMADMQCGGATHDGSTCHIKHGKPEIVGNRPKGSFVCIPERK
jgi:hypothetical protein